MFDDYWWIYCRSQDSAGKRAVKMQYFRRSKIPRKYTDDHILIEDWRSPQESRRGATRAPHLPQARARARPRLGMVWPPWPTSGDALPRISSPRKPKTRGATRNIFRRRCEAENTRERKALRQREICRGEGGNHRHRHCHRAGLHHDDHHHHLHHQHHHHHHLHSIPL